MPSIITQSNFSGTKMIPQVNRSGASYSGPTFLDDTLSTSHTESEAKRPEQRIEQLANLPSRRQTTASIREEANAVVVLQNNYESIRSALPLVCTGRKVEKAAAEFGIDDTKSMAALRFAQNSTMAEAAVRAGFSPSVAARLFDCEYLLNPRCKLAAAKDEVQLKMPTHWVNTRDLFERFEITNLEDQMELQLITLRTYGKHLDADRLKLSAQEIVNKLGLTIPNAVKEMQRWINQRLGHV